MAAGKGLPRLFAASSLVSLCLVLCSVLSLCAGASGRTGDAPGGRHGVLGSPAPAGDGSSAETLRAELDELRRQVETLRNQQQRQQQTRPQQQQQVATAAPPLRPAPPIAPTTEGGGNRARNDRLTAQWVRSAVRELRAEAEESASSQRRAAAEERLRHGEVSSALSLLRSDAASLRRDLEESHAESQRLAAELSQVKAELKAARAEHQSASAVCSRTEEEMKALQSEWMQMSEMLQTSMPRRHTMVDKVLDKGSDQKSDGAASDEHKLRHFGHVHKQLYSLRQSDKQIFAAQMQLEKRVRRVEKVMKVVSDRVAKTADRSEYKCRDGSHEILLSPCALQSLVHELEDKVAGVEEVQKISAKAVAFNSSRQTAALDKLHLSTLQLLESVQAVEEKVDHSLPELQKEISKLEFGMAQSLALSRAAKEEQEGDQEVIKAMRESLEVLQEKERGEVGALGVVQAQLMNVTNRMEVGEQALASRILRLEDYLAGSLPPKVNKHDDEERTYIPDNHLTKAPIVNGSDLPDLFQKLTKIQETYVHVIEQLPKDCSEVSGPSGLYLLHPLITTDNEEESSSEDRLSSTKNKLPSPLLVYCDQNTHGGGWTVIQRRTNGHEDFNRNWREYQEGFGSPTGEFWIGNEALHQMTQYDNCTSLRVDMVDIYGRGWYAEYSTFSVASESDGYRLSSGGYHGDAGDALDYQNGMQFSTKDSDRDTSSTDCAASYEGGWWFSHCQHANLNGRYGLGLTWFDGTRNEWIAVAQSVMKVHRGGTAGGKCHSAPEDHRTVQAGVDWKNRTRKGIMDKSKEAGRNRKGSDGKFDRGT